MSILRNFNYIKRAFRHPCATPSPQIMIETAFEAALPLLFVPVTFSCTDWIKASHGISWKCGRKLEAIAKNVYGPKYIDGIHFLYGASGAAALEAGLYIWFIADLAVDTAANWMTLMYEASGCDLPGAGTIQGGLGALILDPEQIGRMFLDTRQEKECVLVGGNVIQFPSGCQGSVSYSADWAPWPTGADHGGSVTTWLQDDVGNRYSESTSPASKKGGTVSTGGGLNHLHARFIAGTEYSIGYQSHGGLMQCTGGSFTASGQGKSIPLIAPGCFSHFGEPPREPAEPPAHPGPADPPKPHRPRAKKTPSAHPPKTPNPVVKGKKPRKPRTKNP